MNDVTIFLLAEESKESKWLTSIYLYLSIYLPVSIYPLSKYTLLPVSISSHSVERGNKPYYEKRRAPGVAAGIDNRRLRHFPTWVYRG
jgi:hypothetical protein